MKKTLLISLLFVAGILFTPACKKKENGPKKPTTEKKVKKEKAPKKAKTPKKKTMKAKKTHAPSCKCSSCKIK